MDYSEFKVLTKFSPHLVLLDLSFFAANSPEKSAQCRHEKKTSLSSSEGEVGDGLRNALSTSQGNPQGKALVNARWDFSNDSS